MTGTPGNELPLVQYNPKGLQGEQAQEDLKHWLGSAGCFAPLWSFAEDEDVLGAEVVESKPRCFAYVVTSRRVLFGTFQTGQGGYRNEKMWRRKVEDVLFFDPHVSLGTYLKHHKGQAAGFGCVGLFALISGAAGGFYVLYNQKKAVFNLVELLEPFLIALVLLGCIVAFLFPATRVEFVLGNDRGEEESVFLQSEYPLGRLNLQAKSEALERLCEHLSRVTVAGTAAPAFQDNNPESGG